MQIDPVQPKYVCADAQHEIAKFARLIAQCQETQAQACDAVVQILLRHGNTLEAFRWEELAEGQRKDSRNNFKAAFELGRAK